MKLSTKGRYGLRAMLELALRASKDPVMVRDIAASQEIPEDYLEQVLLSLRKAGLVRSQRGSSGGYLLGRQAEEIAALEIVEAVEGPLALTQCLNDPETCSRSGACVARDLWMETTEAMLQVLRNTTLAVLRDRQRAKTVTPAFQI